MYSKDFAVSSKNRNLKIEYDGDAYHIGKEKAVKYNRRDNYC